MNEQWQELKETITEMRDNDGTGTQQEVCKFLVNYMEILEKQMQEPSGDAISRDKVHEIIAVALSEYITDEERETLETLDVDVANIPTVQEPKTGHREYNDIYDHYLCGNCKTIVMDYDNFCPNCGCRMIEPQERGGEE